ncbi:type-F conjugative transfer system mating-pair stabilization protein TraN [Scandinavium goeteborgense]|uniref:Conjugal transfer mating pair stabilization protein TraN n=1 Tax=Scandinavium goeteborgense TaxID=1851514 RepID=A0A4R6E3S2_SCAGO|nr:type-F conjugative transfer system mating-pair stabilization protein TraN [Scandinavium goeteborgense]TDN51488.1 conjugal transfer mating pair stabilization protein TraN [Scandinavium goeteborgense]
MQKTVFLPLLLITASFSAHSAKEFDEGMDWAKQHQSQGTGAVETFNPSQSLSDYTDNPGQKQYYGGVTDSGGDLTTPGMNEMTTSENGQAITDAVIAVPTDNTPSLDAPFITSGTDMQTKADTVTQGSDACTAKNATFNELTNYSCTRDAKVEQACTRTASVNSNPTSSTTTKTYQQVVTLTFSQGKWTGYIDVPAGGTLTTVAVDGDKLPVPWNAQCNKEGVTTAACRQSVGETLSVLDQDFPVEVSEYPSKVTLCSGGRNSHCTNYYYDGAGQIHQSFEPGVAVTLRQAIPVIKTSRNYSSDHTASLSVTVTMTITKTVTVLHPEVVWQESCPFSKAEGSLLNSECTVAGGTHTLYQDGIAYPVTQDCWAWRDTYITQAETEGTCGAYIHNTACTLSSRRCIDAPDGMCVTNQETWSCETKVAGKGKICGGTFFCTDGRCAQGQTGTNNMFGQAVSSLAAVAAAGKDVAELNGENVRAFTGKGMSCKKFAAGFNNCCKDSGWGQSAGLSSCSSEEKALGKAKEKKLTVYVGEYCSKKVLGVCLEKKRGYCQFDSKLARIVQEQGRKGQLGIGFGSGDSPDCRGITLNELQRLKFDIMDFSDFYSDLENGTTIPQDNALLQKAKDIIATKMQEAGK